MMPIGTCGHLTNEIFFCWNFNPIATNDIQISHETKMINNDQTEKTKSITEFRNQYLFQKFYNQLDLEDYQSRKIHFQEYVEMWQ